jgi:predicted nucleotide-binding protein (sugar kinase/HSP70/actin superfamily)
MAHGHIHDLVDSKVTRIFMPMINRLPSETSEPLSTYTCPVLKGYPLVIRYSDDPEHRLNIPLDTPLFHWFTEKDRDDQLARYMRDTFGIDPGLTRRAIIQGDRSLASFYHVMAAEGAEVIARVEKDGGFAVVLAARYYQYDELVNHNLSRYFTNIGIPVLTLDSLPGLRDVDLSKTMLDITNNNHAQLLSGAIIAARHPLLEYVQVFSFGCGHDALYTDEVTRLMAEISGKAPLILKLDESDVAGPLRIRVRSFIETVNARCQKAAQAIESLGDPYPVKFKKNHRKTRTILVPNTSAAFTKILSTAIGKQGCLVEPLPMSGRASLQAGKKYLHNDICFPAQVVIGEAIAYIQKRKFRGDEIAVGMAKFNCDCRLTNYSFLLRRALDEAGYTETPIISTDQLDRKSIHPGFKLSGLSYVRAIWCLIMADILEDLRRKIRPYELEKGETNRVFDQSVDSITYSLKHRGMLGALRAYRYSIDEFCKIRYDRSVPRPVVFIIGEYIANYHPDCNYHIEEYLEQNNMEVKLARMYDVFRKYLLHTVSDVKDFHIRHSLSDTLTAFGGNAFFDIALDGMEKIARKHPLYQNTGRLPRLAEKSDPIIHHSINSGESFLISAELLHNAAEGIRSFVILQPFGCLPNHICGRGVIKKIKEQYPEVQILPLDYDPDTSFANVENRLQMLIMNAREASICG